nr:hypothetical protein BaRGS_030301 [Batillaria attramentaria]
MAARDHRPQVALRHLLHGAFCLRLYRACPQVKDTNRKLLRWSLELQEFDYEVKYVRGEANVLADALSRLN